MNVDAKLPVGPPPEPQRASARDLALVALLPALLAVAVAVWSAHAGVMPRFARAIEKAPAAISGLITLALLTPVVTLVVVWRRLHSAHAAHLRLTELARLDSLTGLPNRFGLEEQLAEAITSSRASGMAVAVLFIDLDRFKVVNDTFGHEVGDALMKSVATRLRQALRPMDQVVRYGGDEFVVICPEVANVGTAERIAQRVIDALKEPFTIGRQSLSISSSIGIALADYHATSVDQVVRDADVAMYQAKGAGSGTYRFYDRTIGGALTPSAIEDRLRRAIEHNEFRVFYQPVVATDTGHILGVEALLRWNDPERGLIGPDDFLPILEETGLIVPVGTWVFTEACRQAMRWRQAFPEHPLELKVNVSARQLSQVDFGEMIARVLAETGLPTTLVFLELTESALMDDVSSAWTMLREAKTRGVRLALDDFGTGFSSLSYIRRFSLDMLKIDKSFVEGLAHEPDDVAIVEHVIGMARALGMVTVAEGVEQAEQLRQLQRLGCDRAQGFWFSPPVPAELIGPMLTDQTLAQRWSDVRPAAPVTPPTTESPSHDTAISPSVVGMLRGIPARPLESTDAAFELPPIPHTPLSPPTFTKPVALDPPSALPPMVRRIPHAATGTGPKPHTSPPPGPRPTSADTGALPAGFSTPRSSEVAPSSLGHSAPPPVPTVATATATATATAAAAAAAAADNGAQLAQATKASPTEAPRPPAAPRQRGAVPRVAPGEHSPASHSTPTSPTPPRDSLLRASIARRVAPPPPAPRAQGPQRQPLRTPTSLPQMREVTPEAPAEPVSPG